MVTPPEGPGLGARLADALAVAALAGTGLAVVFLGVFGAEPADQARALRVAVALLCFLAAYLWFHARLTSRALARVEDLLTDVLFGEGTRRDREAVDILVQALRTPDARARETALRTLRKISGLDLGEEPGPWEAWWRASRPTFTRPGKPPRGGGGPPREGPGPAKK